METIEAGVPDFTIQEAKNYEYGKVDRRNMTDLELCSLIDNKLVPKLLKHQDPASLYMLPESKRAALFESLWNECRQARWQNNSKGIFANKYVTESQLRRCLVFHSMRP